MTLALLLAMLAFMIWAPLHTWERVGWYDDERLAEEYVALLRSAGVQP